MNLKPFAFTKHKRFKPLVGAALTILCGIALWQMPLGERWVHSSYDYVFRFGSRAITNDVVLIVMDNDAYKELGQIRGEPWDRRLHTNLLNKLADDGCALTILDVFLEERREPAVVDEALAAAMRRQKKLVLGARQSEEAKGRNTDSVSPIQPDELFINAAQTNWAVAWFDPDLGDEIVRRHWPFRETVYESLPAVAARVAGAHWDTNRFERWLRYYGKRGAWPTFSYHVALAQPTNFFQNKIVFVGNKPETPAAGDGEKDEFRTPYTRWRGWSAGGVELLITAFLNLNNNEWLRRFDPGVEMLVLIASGGLIFFALNRVLPIWAVGVAAVAALGVVLAGVSLSYFTNYWFPYLVIAGGQIPFALAWRTVRFFIDLRSEPAVLIRSPDLPGILGPVQSVADYELVEPAFGEGAYGKVWLACNAIGQWQAFKSVHLEKFQNNADPYEREFNGIKRYKPISDKHPGLLRVDFVSRKRREGYFYYVMELADSWTPGWEANPKLYKPRDLASARDAAPEKRLPISECISIGMALAEALDFLHEQKLSHRDIKPSNVLFVNGRPKLGDLGLVSELRPATRENTCIGTFGYMPPTPETPGTAQADIYGLGKVLYVISTGREPNEFPELSATMVEETDRMEFQEWNRIILHACNPDCAKRYQTVAELLNDLRKLKEKINAHRAKRSRENV